MARYSTINGKLECGSHNCNKKAHLHYDSTNGVSYCWQHFSVPETREFSADLRRRIWNRKKERLCDAFACNRKDLLQCRGGLFCPYHQNRVEELRLRIQPHMGTDDEIYARFVELHFRKRCDQGHWDYAVQWVTENRERLPLLIRQMKDNLVFVAMPEYYEPVKATMWFINQELFVI